MDLLFFKNNRDYLKNSKYLPDLNEKIRNAEYSLPQRIEALKKEIVDLKENRELLSLCDSFCENLLRECDRLDIQGLYETHDDWSWDLRSTLYSCPFETVTNQGRYVQGVPSGDYAPIFKHYKINQVIHDYLEEQFNIICYLVKVKYPQRQCSIYLGICETSQYDQIHFNVQLNIQ